MTMNDIQQLILKVFGVALNSSEIEEVQRWFDENKGAIGNPKELRSKLGPVVLSKSKGKMMQMFEEDTSNLDYLLLLLLNQGKKNK